MTKHVGRAMGALGLLLLGCSGSTADGPAGGGGSGGTSDTMSGGHLPGAPPSQGAFTVTVKSSSPTPAGKSCPVAAATSSVPVAPGAEALDSNTYLHWVVDGDGAASVSCRVVGNSTFTFQGRIGSAGKVLEISNGTIAADGRGTASVTLSDSANLAAPLSSPAGTCSVNAAKGSIDGFQVQPGSMWAGFTCPSLEAAPSDYCTASGIFVLENCLQK